VPFIALLAFAVTLAEGPVAPASATPPRTPPTTGPSAAPPGEPAYPVAGWKKARELDPGCMRKAVAGSEALRFHEAQDFTLEIAVGADGRVQRVRGLPADLPGGLVAAAGGAVGTCRFAPGQAPGGAPAATWLLVAFRFRVGKAQGESVAAAEVERGCVARELRVPAGSLKEEELRFRIRVAPDGKAAGLEVPADLADGVVAALQEAVDRCPLKPARAAGGEAVEGAITLRLRLVAQRDGARTAEVAGPAAPAAPSLARPARLKGKGCLRGIQGLGRVGEATVRVRVSEQGVPEDYAIQPHEVPADLRSRIMDALASCEWAPALDAAGKPVTGSASVVLRDR